MSNAAETLIETAKIIDPQGVAAQVAGAALETATNPSPENILKDAELAISLVKQLRASLQGTHPSIGKLVKSLLKELI